MQFAVPSRWGSVESLPVLLCNQLAVQGIQESVVLTFGFAAPPLLPGTPEEQQAELEKLGGLTVQPLARFNVPLSALMQMVPALQTIVDRAKQAAEAAGVALPPPPGAPPE
jgi:hypothetical protein